VRIEWVSEALKARNKSIPNISFVVIDSIALQEFAVFILERDALMVNSLPGDVAL